MTERAATTANSSSPGSAPSSTPFADLLIAQLDEWQATGSTSDTAVTLSSTSTDQQPVTSLLSSSPRHLLFCVDDMLFFHPHHEIPWHALCSALDGDQSILGALLALHPAIDYCHPANKKATRPFMFVPINNREDAAASTHATAASSSPVTPAASPLDASVASSLPSITPLRFLRGIGGGSLDWNYPMSLCGGLYRLNDVRQLLSMAESMHGRSSFNHPNKLEVVLNEMAVKGCAGSNQGDSEQVAPTVLPSSAQRPSASPLMSLASHRPWSICMSQAVMAVVTVNRVQEIYANPVYSAADGNNSYTQSDTDASTSDDSTVSPLDLSADGLLRLHRSHPSMRFDLDRYRRVSHTFKSVHIGEFFIKERDDAQQPDTNVKSNSSTGVRSWCNILA